MRSIKPGTALIVASLLLSAAVGADTKLYRWVDKEGHAHYGDQPGSPAAKEVNPKALNRVDEDSAAAGAATADAAAKQAAACKQKSDQLNSYTKATSVTETDALGNQREYTADEKAQLVAKTQKYVDEHCPSPAAAP